MPRFASIRLMLLGVVCSFFLFGQDATPAPTEGSTTPPVQQEGVADERLAPSNAAGVDPNSYRIGAGDVINIRVWREPELSLQQGVRPDGRLTMQLIGDIEVVDKTPNEIVTAITDKLKEFIVNPSVMVAVTQVRSKKYTITGEVGRPGSYPLLAPTTVLDALTNSGGFRDFANKKKITIIRGEERLKFNYNDVIKGKNREQNIELRDGDLIVVPD